MRSKLRWLLACLLVVGLLTCPALAAFAFPDVSETASYSEAVEYLNDVGIMQGDTQGNFNPDKAVSRAEMATILCRMLGEDENLTTSNAFADVPLTHWANTYITKASELGIINGYGNGKFGPNDTVTYEQAITMVIRAVNLEAEAISAGGYPDGFIAIADDYGYTEGLFLSKGDLLTRWQVATILHNLLVI